MYIILWWQSENDNFLTTINNTDGSVRLFDTLSEADNYANTSPHSDDLRVINIEAVKV